MRAFVLALSLAVLTASAAAQTKAHDNWPQWRGPTGNGVAPGAKPPIEWSETKNIRWKVPVSGEGHAAPIVWGDRIYLLAAIKTDKTVTGAPQGDAIVQGPSSATEAGLALAQESSPRPGSEVSPRPGQDGPPRREGRRGGFGDREPPKNIYRFVVIALDRKTGKTVWERPVKEARPHESVHTDSTQVSNSPVTDGQFIYAFFGSRGLYCLDLDGNVKWEKDFGQMSTANQFGEGASPAVHGEVVVVNWDHEGDDFIVALDRTTGNELWRKPRNERTTWCTPYIVTVAGKPQAVVPGAKACIAYDLKTGETVWECGGLTANVIPTPVCEDGMLIMMSGFRGAAVKAIKLAEARGKLEDGSPAIAWTFDKNTPYVPSPVLVDGLLYFFDNNRPVLTCLDARTGKKHFGPERIDGLNNIYASPIAANGHVYLVARNGKTVVITQTPELKIVATNELDDEIDASPAAVGGELFLRGKKSLYCIAGQ